MPEITMRTGVAGNKTVVFKDGIDLSEFDPDKLHDWVFEYAEPTTGTLLSANDAIHALSLTYDPMRGYEPTAYALAYDLGFSAVHCRKITGLNVSLSGKLTVGSVQAVPANVLRAFVRRADTSSGMTEEEYETLKKPAAATENPPPTD